MNTFRSVEPKYMQKNAKNTQKKREKLQKKLVKNDKKPRITISERENSISTPPGAEKKKA